MSFLRFLLFLRLNFPKRKRFSFWFWDVYSEMSSVNICLKCITFWQILLDKTFLFPDPMNISWIRFKTVVLYRAKRITSWNIEKTDHIGVFDMGNNSCIVIKNQLFLKLWIFQLFCLPFVSENAFFSSSANNFQMCNLSRYILTITWIHVSPLHVSAGLDFRWMLILYFNFHSFTFSLKPFSPAGYFVNIWCFSWYKFYIIHCYWQYFRGDVHMRFSPFNKIFTCPWLCKLVNCTSGGDH